MYALGLIFSEGLVSWFPVVKVVATKIQSIFSGKHSSVYFCKVTSSLVFNKLGIMYVSDILRYC